MNSRTPCRLLALLLLASVMAAQLEKANAVPAERLPRTVADLFPDDEEAWQPDEIDAVAVEGAEVVLADYALLRQDFPDQLGELGDDGIRQWLLTHTALMRVEQLNASVQEMELHTAIPVDEDRTRALHSSGRKQYAPFFYGRAMIIEVPGGFIDAKGTGAAAPSLKDHSSGVMRLGGMGAIDEAIYERLTWEVLQLVGSPISTVRTYAVLRLPVSLIPSEELDEGRTGWASNVSKTTHTLGIYLRQVHRKCHDSVFSLACNNLVRHFEHTVRPFGLTSTINYTSFHRQPHLSSDDIADSRNHWAFAPMQCSFNSDIVDFGSYSTRSAFTRKLAQYSLLTSSAAEKYASPPIMTAEESPQPDSCYAVDFDHWGTNEEGIVFDDLMRHRVDEIAAGSAAEIQRFYDETFHVLRERWQLCREQGVPVPRPAGAVADVQAALCPCSRLAPEDGTAGEGEEGEDEYYEPGAYDDQEEYYDEEYCEAGDPRHGCN